MPLSNPTLLRTKSIDPTNAADAAWWQTQSEPPDSGTVGPGHGKVVFVFRQVDSDDNVVAFDANNTTADVRAQLFTTVNGVLVLGGAVERPGHDLSEVVTVEAPPGWSVALWMSAVTSPGSGTVAVQVWAQSW